MKKQLLAIALSLTTSALLAQDCTNFIYMKKNKVIEMTDFDKKHNVVFKTVSTVTDVSTANGVTTATITTQGFDKDGKLMNTSGLTYKCDGTTLMAEINIGNGQMPNQKMVSDLKMANKNYMEFPSTMQVGDHLKDASSVMQTTMQNGMVATTTVNTTDRVIVAKESVTTAGGTWDCFKITYKTTISSKVGGGTSPQADTLNGVMGRLAKMGLKVGGLGNRPPTVSTIWYAPNFGEVKMESEHSTMELTSIK